MNKNTKIGVEVDFKSLLDLEKELKKASASMKEASNAMDFKKSKADVDDLKGKMKNMTGEISNSTAGFGKLKGATSVLSPAIGGAIEMVEKFSKALLTSPIGWIVLGVTALVAILAALGKAFTGTASGGEKFKEIIGGIKNVVEVVMNTLGQFVLGIVDFLKGDFKKGLGEMGDAWKGIGGAIGEAYTAGQDYAKGLKEMNIAHLTFIQREADLKKVIAEQMLIFSDQANSHKVRAEALKKVMTAQAEIDKHYVEEAKKSAQLEESKFLSTVKINGMNVVQKKVLLDKLLSMDKEQLNKEIALNPQAKAMWEALYGIDGATYQHLIEGKTKITDAITAQSNNQKANLKKESGQNKADLAQAAADAKKAREDKYKSIHDGIEEEINQAKTIQDIHNQSYDDDKTKLKKSLDDKTITQQEYNDQLNGLIDKHWIQQLMDNDNNYQLELKDLDAQLKNKIISQELYDAKVKSLKLKNQKDINSIVIGAEKETPEAVKPTSDKSLIEQSKRAKDSLDIDKETYAKKIDIARQYYDKNPTKEGLLHIQNLIKESNAQQLADVTKYYDLEEAKLSDDLDKKIITEQEYWEKLDTLNKQREKDLKNIYLQADTSKDEQKLKDKHKKTLKDIEGGLVDLAGKITGSIFQNASDQIQKTLDKTLDSIDKMTEKSQSNLDKLNQRKFISDAEYQRRKDKLDAEKTKKETEAKKEAAKKQKENAVEQAIIGAFLSAVMSLAMGGPTGIAMAAITLGLGLADAAIIAAKPLSYKSGTSKVPSFASGGFTSPNGDQNGIPAMLHPNEAVLNATAMSQIGMKGFVEQGNAGQAVQTNTRLHPDDLKSLAGMINDKKVYVVQSDIQKQNNKVAVLQNRSSF